MARLRRARRELVGAAPLILLLLVVFGAPALRAAEIASDELWQGEVLVEETTEVLAGATLTIAPGTTVRFEDGVRLVVRGRLVAEGEEADQIRFTRARSGAEWGGIRLIRAEKSRIRHAIVEYVDSEGDHKDYYDDFDESCQPILSPRPPRDYHEAVVAIACELEIDSSIFRNLPDPGGQGDAIAVISDDPVDPGTASAVITNSEFIAIGQGIHTRYSHVLVEGCYFTGHRGDNDDIDLFGESDPPPLIRGNIFEDPENDDAINPTRSSAIIVGNIITGSNDHGIVLRDRCAPVVMNNVIVDCDSAAISVQNTCDALIVNNTIYDCGRGVRFFDHTGRWGLPYCLTPGNGRATVVNTVIANCRTSFDLEDSTYEPLRGAHVLVLYSSVEGGEETVDIDGSESTVTWGEGNMDVDPMFVDPENGDFRLAEGSLLIDSGTEESAPLEDLAGHARPCGLGVDVGAYEAGDCATGELRFRRGDVNGRGGEDISDPIALLLHLFAGREAPPCEKAADVDDSGSLELTDSVYLLSYLFQSGSPPSAPYPECGVDPTADELACVEAECE
ncbi:MAG TPA: right-handed parallel beta-helix repeat-containing protein [Planctomycetota bacterium]|nr:right-handed parallel beta-helix repeat-containing protein [Planctomycetota bacterium]